MSTWRRWAGTVCAVVLTLGIATPTFAGMPASAMEERSVYVDGILRKLGRGIANVATCPLELPRTIEVVERREGWGAGLTVGILQGIWRTLLRGTAGIYEVVTFYAEAPEGFKPIITPEFVFGVPTWSADQ